MAEYDDRVGDLLPEGSISPDTEPKGAEPAAETDPGALRVGQWVEHYLVRRLIGEGGMGRVYLARDKVLGRRVALKVLKPDVFTPEERARFLEEARAVARFSHPHIVVIYGVGEIDGAPYLALEYLDGTSLRTRIESSPMASGEIVRVALAIAQALAEAHRVKIIHADLKPENVVIPSDGRPRVVDFGLAQDQRRAESGFFGTFAYMAPERFFGAPPTPASDVWALGVMLYELVEGHRPFLELSPDVLCTLASDRALPSPVFRTSCPAVLLQAITSCLAADPSARPSAAELARRFEHHLHPDIVSDDEGPFRGLACFEERHAATFFGREAEISSAVERLRAQTILPIVGPSGAGKSSFVQAGLVPRLRERERWVVVRIRPGDDPMRVLAYRLASVSTSSGEVDVGLAELIHRELSEGPVQLGLRLQALADSTRSRVLVLVDQLEELFTQVPSAEARARFAAALGLAAEDPGSPVRVVFTIRDDFFGRLVELDALRPSLAGVMPLRPLDAEQLASVITAPLRLVDHRFESPGRVEQMVAQVTSLTAPLPILQFALGALWERRDRTERLITERAFEQVGGVAGALTTHAESVIQSLLPDQRPLARGLFLRLVGPSGLRHARSRTELVGGLPEGVEVVLERLISARLLTTQSRRDRERDALVEITHESLVTAWSRLRRWLDETREEAVIREEIERAAQLWIARGRRPAETWSGDTLAEARAKLQRLAIDLPPNARAFIAAGEARDAWERRRRRAVFAAAGTLLATIAVAGVIAALVFRDKEQEAQRQRREINTAVADIGRVRFEVHPFDWDPSAHRAAAVSASEYPTLRWQLHSLDPTDRHRPGPAFLPEQAHLVESTTSTAGARIDVVDAKGGPAFLEVRGRGARGEDCGPSWVPIQSLPGYADRARGEVRTLRVFVPTCAATRANLVEIAAGEFVFVTKEAAAERGDPHPEEKIIDLPTFAIDRTEVTNAAYDMFAKMSAFTGEPVPAYPSHPMYRPGSAPAAPVAGLNAYEADAYCAYLGKRLPTEEQWVKAARGGLVLGEDRHPNPLPRRKYVWGEAPVQPGANLEGPADGHEGVAPVGVVADDQSPYGVRDLAGNVLEWTASRAYDSTMQNLRALRGGSWLSPHALRHDEIGFMNARDPRFPDYLVGFRCASVPE